MYFFSALLFSISANIDTLVLGFSYGIRKQSIPLFTNIVISFITFFGTYISIGAGIFLTKFFPLGSTKTTGNLLLILLGSFYCLKYLLRKWKRPLPEDSSLHAQSQKIISNQDTFFLGLALTINNAGLGITASLAGIHFLLTCFLTLVLSFSFLIIGNRLGTRISSGFFQHSADLLSGIIIIVMGIFHCFL